MPKEDYIDPRYKKYIRSKSGRKMLEILRILTHGIADRKKLEDKTGFSTSEVRKLLLKAREQNFVVAFEKEGKFSGRRGRPKKREPQKETGRPPSYYALTGEGMWLIRLDPQVRDHWNQVEMAYKNVSEFSDFASYANLIYAIQKHPILRQYRKPYYFMDQELEQVPLNPFIWGGPFEREVEKVYDELVKTIKENVRSNHISSYYRVLEEAVSELDEIITRHKLLMKKMRTLPEVQAYINNTKV